MGFAKHNRGTRHIARDIQKEAAPCNARASYQALSDENQQLRERLHAIAQSMQNARRCLASGRMGRDALAARIIKADQDYAFTVEILCKKIRQYDPEWQPLKARAEK